MSRQRTDHGSCILNCIKYIEYRFAQKYKYLSVRHFDRSIYFVLYARAYVLVDFRLVLYTEYRRL